jgi:hypothetical protein
VRVEYSASGELPIRHPGKLNVAVKALYYTQSGGEPPIRGPSSGPPRQIKHELAMSTRIFSPDGNLFTADQVTLADLERFRDLRGTSQGTWRYETSGTSAPIATAGPPRTWVIEGPATVIITIHETITSRSAGPLVSASSGTTTTQDFSFDLFRIGQFVAKAARRRGEFHGAAAAHGS